VKINDIMGRPRTINPTPVHLRILKAIASYSQNGRYTSITDLVADLGLARDTSLTPTLKIMQRNGFIEIHGGGKRGRRRLVTLTTRGKSAIGLGELRIIGHIPAGPLTEVLDECEIVIEAHELLPHKPGDFLLIVHGDSMIGDGILPGDKVLLRPDIQAKNGEIAAVYVGDDYLATLKHVHFGPGRSKVTLKASNPAYENIVAAAKDVKIAGVYRGLVRNG
jgi:repressor LexA